MKLEAYQNRNALLCLREAREALSSMTGKPLTLKIEPAERVLDRLTAALEVLLVDVEVRQTFHGWSEGREL